MFGPVRATVADNEAFIAHVGSFLVTGSRHLPDVNQTDGMASNRTVTGNETAESPTPTENTPSTPTPQPGTATPTRTASPESAEA
jgi:hypothetical protein